MELRDNYHMELPDKNQHITLVHFMSILHVLQLYGNPNWTDESKRELARLGRHNYRDPNVHEENPNRQSDLRNDAYDAIRNRIFKSGLPIAQQPPSQVFI